MTPEERIARLLRALPSPPRGWMEAAKELPTARRELDTIVERIEHDAQFRPPAHADPEEALRGEGGDAGGASRPRRSPRCSASSSPGERHVHGGLGRRPPGVGAAGRPREGRPGP